jgi:hypothetical protein
MTESSVKKSTPAPAAWGLTYTVQNALKIFTAPPTAAAAPAVPAK